MQLRDQLSHSAQNKDVSTVLLHDIVLHYPIVHNVIFYHVYYWKQNTDSATHMQY